MASKGLRVPPAAIFRRNFHARQIGLAVVRPTEAASGALFAEFGADSPWQHDHAILVALRFPHDDHLFVELDVLDSQAQRLHETHPRAVKKPRDQPREAIHGIEQLLDFGRLQHGGKAAGVGRALGFFHPGQFDAEDLPIQEEEGAERLAVGGGGNATFGSEHRQEGLHLTRAHVAGVLQPVPPDEEPDPVDVSLFCPDAIVAITDLLPHLV